MWELDHKEGWAPKHWYLWTVVLKKTLESPLDYKEIKPINPKGNQLWIFIVRTDAEAEALILWPPDVKSQLIRKDPDTGKDWSQVENGTIEDEMVGWHHWLMGHEFEQTRRGSKDREAWHAAVHGVTKHWTQLNDLTTTTIHQSVCVLIHLLTHFCFIVRFFQDIGTPDACKTLLLPLRASRSDDLGKTNEQMAW